MPRAQRMRIVNFPYDSNSKYIGDLLLDFNSEDSLIKLANGGGKTSLILLMAMCVDPTIKIGDRSILTYFQNYRTTTHIAVEWLLDGEEKRYLLTGLTVRSNGQEVSYFTYTMQYGWQNDYDIEHIPWIRRGESGRQLVGYHEFLDSLEKHPDNGREQRPRIFQSTEYGRKKHTEFLKTYSILKEEWKAMVKANVAEGGVDAIFNEQRTSGELVKKSFLPIIETVVLPSNQVKGSALFDTVRAFVRNLVALPQIQQQAHYYEEFLRRGEAWQAGAEAYQVAVAREAAERERAAVLVKSADHAVAQSTEQVLALEADLSVIVQDINELEYQEASSQFHEQTAEAERIRQELTGLLEKIAQLEHERQDCKQELKLLRARQVFDEWNELRSTVEKEQEELRQATLSNGETVADVNAYAAQLLPLLAIELEQSTTLLHEREQSMSQQEQAIHELRHVTQPRLAEQYTQTVQKLQEILSRDQEHKREELKLRKQLGNLNMFFDTRQEITSREDRLQQCRKDQSEQETQLKDNAVLTRRLEEEAEHLVESSKALVVATAEAANQVNEFEAQLEEVRRIAGYYQTDTKDVYSGRTLAEIRLRTAKQQDLLTQERRKLHVLQMQTELVGEESYCLPNAEVKRAVEEINWRFATQEAITGSEYLYQQDNREQAEWYLRRYPLLPYSVVMTAKGLQAIDAETVKAISARFAVPIMLREVLGGEPVIQDDYVYRPLDEIAFLLPYETEHYLSKDVLADLRALLRNQMASTLQAVANLENSLIEYASHSKSLETHRQRYPAGGEALYQAKQASIDQAKTVERRQKEVKISLQSERGRRSELDAAVTRLIQAVVDTKRELGLLADFLVAEEQVNALRTKQPELGNRLRLLKQEKDDAIAAEDKLRDAVTSLRQELQRLTQAVRDKDAFMVTVQQSLQADIAASILEPVNDLSSLTGRWQAAVDKLAGLNSGTKELAARLDKDRLSLRKKGEQFASNGITADQLYTVSFSYPRITDLETRLEKTEQAINQASTEQGVCQNKLSTAETLTGKTRKNILNNHAKEPLPGELLPTLAEIERQLSQQRQYHQQAEVGLSTAQEQRREYVSAKTIIDSFAQDEGIIPGKAFRFVADPAELINEQKIVRADLQQAKARKEKTRQQVASVFQTLKEDFSKADMDHIRSFLLSFAISGDEEAIYDAVAIAQIFGDSKALIENNLRNWRQKREELEREQQEIAAITARYLKDMIEQIKRIANLSKATIAGRTIAMMRIRNYEMTDQMLRDAVSLYVDRTIRELEGVSDSELEGKARLAFNLQRLFAAIIPMERIEVEILKVREYGESEYVAWESLSVKNSGGEGFLSYFSVFLPLLTYIRDAEGAGSRTAKVFIADNPFGKMVSPHLVRVVMDMARRTNTQVIAFTGISDAKIYPFFDRIYSLSLFPVNASTKLRIEIEVAKEGSGATKLSSMDVGLAAGAKSLFQENLF